MCSVRSVVIVIVVALAQTLIVSHALADQTTTESIGEESTTIPSTTIDSYSTSTDGMPTTTTEALEFDTTTITTERDEFETTTIVSTTEMDTTTTDVPTTTEETITSTTVEPSPTTTEDVAVTTVEPMPVVTDAIDEKPMQCQDGLILSAWKPDANLTFGDRFSRGLVYFFALSYLMLGVSIASDRFVASIEKITAIERTVEVQAMDGAPQTVVVRVWNQTIANLTLMALGASAPEILLSTFEVFSKHFDGGVLGPATVLGSAAFDMFVIVGICVLIVPDGEVRKIKNLRVFIVTATLSILAFLWLYFILDVCSPGVISLPEALITFLLFPLTVWLAYTADRRTHLFKYTQKKYRLTKNGIIVVTETNSGIPLKNRSASLKSDSMPDDYKDFNELKAEYIAILRELRAKHPQYDRDTLEVMAQQQLLDAGPKSRAYYRLQSARKILGGGNILRKIAERTQSEAKSELSAVAVYNDDDELTPRILFDPQQYTVMENCGSVKIRVVRRGDFSGHVSVNYHTEDGSAEAILDYVATRGTITFTPGIDERFIEIVIIDDEIFEEDEQFYVRLSNPTNGAILGMPDMATVKILDDDHGGFFQFDEESHEVIESIGHYEMKVVRLSGARGRVAVPYWTEDGSAKAGKAFEGVKSQLIFEDNVTE